MCYRPEQPAPKLTSRTGSGPNNLPVKNDCTVLIQTKHTIMVEASPKARAASAMPSLFSPAAYITVADAKVDAERVFVIVVAIVELVL